MTIRVHLPDGTTHVGRVVDLRGESDIEADALRRAVVSGLPVEADAPRVVCPRPSPPFTFLAYLEPEMVFDRRGALAAVARARGHEVPAERKLERVEGELAAVEPPEPTDLAAARRRAASAGAETDRLRERAATIRGRLEAVRESGGDAEAAETALRETMTRLSEVATDRVAAQQRLDMLESRTRAARDRREERMRLEDRAGNLRREVRRSLAAVVYDEFAEAVAALPAPFDADAGTEPGAFDGRAVAAALGVARMATLRAPVVADSTLADAFGGLPAFVRALDAPVVVL